MSEKRPCLREWASGSSVSRSEHHQAPRPSSPPWIARGVTAWIVLALCLLTLGAMGAYLSVLEHRRIGGAERERLVGQARIITANIERQIYALCQGLDCTLTELPEWRAGSWSEASRHLTALCATMPGVRTMLITDRAGVTLASNRPELIGRNFADRKYFQAVKSRADPGVVHLSPPFRTALGVQGMNLAKMAPGENGAFDGVVAATLDPEYFATLLGSVLYAEDMLSSIVHGDGLVFIVLPGREDLSGMDLAKPGTQFSAYKASGKTEDVTTGFVTATGDTRIIAHETLAASRLRLDNQFVLAVSRKVDNVYADWRRHALVQTGVFLAVLVSSCLALYAYRRRVRTFQAQEAEAASALEESERFLRTVTDNIPALVGYWTKDLTCKFANPAYRQWFGKLPQDMLGASLEEVLSEELFRKSFPHVQAVLRGEPQHFERVLVKADGNASHTLVHYIPDGGGDEVRGFYALAVDITELKTAQARLESLVRELRELAATDPLTGASNRRAFFEQAAREVERSKRFGEPMAVLMIDLDHFKSVNDRHGHECGDEVLKAMAAHSRRMLRSVDLFCRLGGEEFAVVLVNTRLDGAAVFAERLRRTLEELEVVCKDERIRFTVSIGAASFACGTETLEEALRRADTALYVAKHAGRNQVHVQGLGD